ncbi:glycosyltransferase family 4 protein [Bizionia sediminis]|uniref:Glycosyltransferase family 4 protein n=1 Tax=Bizionia sediminis TaxID=1737064 RepID=A0ABW5KRN4_9FLAO
MKKIGLVLSQPPSYSETFFNSKIKGLKENGHTVTLFTGPCVTSYKACTHKTSPKLYAFLPQQLLNMLIVGVQLLPYLNRVTRFYVLEKQAGSSTKRIIEKVYLNAQLLKFKGDWLHFGFATLAIGRELVAKAIGAKMAVSFRGYDLNVYPLKHPDCYNLLWQHVDKVQSISKYLLAKGYALGLSAKIPYAIITPAVNLATLPSKNINTSENLFKIVTISRYNWIKGMDYLIETATHLKTAGVAFEWHVIGSGTADEMERYVFHIHQSDLEQQLIFNGKQSHSKTLNIVATANLYVQTSLNEGFCNAILEAQALGVPCVAFNVGGIPENIKELETGWLIVPYDTAAMAERITAFMSLPSAEKQKLADQAIARVQTHFSLEAQKQAFNEFYIKK